MAPVREVHIVDAQADHEEDHGHFDGHDGGIESRALFDPDNQDRGDDQRDQKGRKVKPISTPKTVGALSKAWAFWSNSGGCALTIASTLSRKACVPGCSAASEACAICRATIFEAVLSPVQWS